MESERSSSALLSGAFANSELTWISTPFIYSVEIDCIRRTTWLLPKWLVGAIRSRVSCWCCRQQTLIGAMSDASDPRMHELTIELRDVVREYTVGGQSVRALDGISLRLSGGQFVSVV